MGEAVFFSVIVPIYNTPIPNLEKMYESILSQEYQNFELLLIDDGSRTECSRYLDELSRRDMRVKVVHTANKGVSSARNKGIDISVGQYIVFVDADDYVSERFLLEAKELIFTYNVDILFGTMVYIPDRHIKQSDEKIHIFYSEDFVEIKKAIIESKNRDIEYCILGTPCARVYKAEMVKKTKFHTGVPLYEDQLFNREILSYAASVAVVPNIWYYYIQNDFSAMHNTMKKSYVKMVRPYWDAVYEINKEEIPELRKELRIHALMQFYTAIEKDYLYSALSFVRKRKEISRLAKHKLISDAVKNIKISDKDLNISQKMGLVLMKLQLYGMVYLGQKVKKRKKHES